MISHGMAKHPGLLPAAAHELDAPSIAILPTDLAHMFSAPLINNPIPPPLFPPGQANDGELPSILFQKPHLPSNDGELPSILFQKPHLPSNCREGEKVPQMPKLDNGQPQKTQSNSAQHFKIYSS